jgi:hypothetical protein
MKAFLTLIDTGTILLRIAMKLVLIFFAFFIALIAVGTWKR